MLNLHSLQDQRASARNREGLTFTEWCVAARLDQGNHLRIYWKDGVDPSDIRAEKERLESQMRSAKRGTYERKER